MQFEKLKKDNHKKIIIGGLILVGVLSAIVLTSTRAKYKTTQSINIVNGTINYKPYDFKILAMYKQKEGSACTEDSCYEEITGRMPSSGYVINESKSYCTIDGKNNDTEAVLKTINGIHAMSNLAKNEKCKLYFDKVITINDIIASLNAKETAPTYSSVATTDEGVYKISDGMYGGYSYVFRGAVKNNWVKFANMYWRIIRINGDGSIRLIYTGNSTLSNVTVDANGITAIGEGTQIGSYAYNQNNTRSEYVGYTYTDGQQRPTNTATGTPSNLKTQTESWYYTNIIQKGYDGDVVTGKFCNDRNVQEGTTWASQPSSKFYYAGSKRLYIDYKPTLACSDDDVYNLKVGAITADEVEFAGGKNENNSSYYLYNGQNYWTMSPYCWSVDVLSSAWVFVVSSYGYLDRDSASGTFGLRPVINLSTDTQFTSGLGTSENPYVVV